MLSTACWLETLQRAKKGVETIHFAKFWQKIGVEIRHFPNFCSNIGVETIQIFQRPEKGGRNGGAYVVTFIEWVPSPGYTTIYVCISKPYVDDRQLHWSCVTDIKKDRWSTLPCVVQSEWWATEYITRDSIWWHVAWAYGHQWLALGGPEPRLLVYRNPWSTPGPAVLKGAALWQNQRGGINNKWKPDSFLVGNFNPIKNMQPTVLRTLLAVLALCLLTATPSAEGQAWVSNLGHRQDLRDWLERTHGRQQRGMAGDVQPRAEPARYPLQKLMPFWTESKRGKPLSFSFFCG